MPAHASHQPGHVNSSARTIVHTRAGLMAGGAYRGGGYTPPAGKGVIGWVARGVRPRPAPSVPSSPCGSRGTPIPALARGAGC